MASNGIANGGFAFSTPAVLVPNGLSKIKTKKTVSREVCKDGDTAAAPLKGVLQNVDDLHALQKKKASAPSTPKSPMNPSTPRNMTPRAAYTTEEERHKQQMESIRYQAPPTPSQIMRVQYSCTAFYCTIFRPIAAPVHQSNCWSAVFEICILHVAVHLQCIIGIADARNWTSSDQRGPCCREEVSPKVSCCSSTSHD